MKHLDFGNMSTQFEPSLNEIYARCLDIVRRVTNISSEAHRGLTSDEFQVLKEISDDLLCLYMNISYRYQRFSAPSDPESVDDNEILF